METTINSIRPSASSLFPERIPIILIPKRIGIPVMTITSSAYWGRAKKTISDRDTCGSISEN